jgi:hypothetical protein
MSERAMLDAFVDLMRERPARSSAGDAAAATA